MIYVETKEAIADLKTQVAAFYKIIHIVINSIVSHYHFLMASFVEYCST